MKTVLGKICVWIVCVMVSICAVSICTIEIEPAYAMQASNSSLNGGGEDSDINIVRGSEGMYMLGEEDACDYSGNEETELEKLKKSVSAGSEDEYFSESKEGSYTVLTLLVQSGDDIWKSCQAALEKARDCAQDNGQYKVVIPAGTYTLKTSLSIYSNTWIVATGAEIKMRNGGRMIRNGTDTEGLTNTWSGYGPMKNITVQGGTWDGNAQGALKLQKEEGSNRTFSNMRFGHMKNLKIKNVVIRNNLGAHHLEMGAVDGAVISGCTFSDY